MNGDKYKTGKLTPEGEPDPSVFSTEHNREGIQVGTAIALLARRKQHEPVECGPVPPLLGPDKLAELARAWTNRVPYPASASSRAVRWACSLMPADVALAILAWPRITDLFPTSFPGVKTSRDELCGHRS